MKVTQVCSVVDCDGKAIARSWCGKHYYRWSKHGDPLTVDDRIRTGPTCDAPECDRPSPNSTYCNMHKLRLHRTGRLDRPAPVNRRPHSQGYILIRDEAHPLAVGEWLYEHRAVLFADIGPGVHACHWCATTVTWDRSYPEHADGLVVDHLDEDKTNNDPMNLVPSCATCNFARSNRWVKQRREAANQ